jgi:hypothetical protein
MKLKIMDLQMVKLLFIGLLMKILRLIRQLLLELSTEVKILLQLLLQNNAATLAERRLKAGVGKPIPAFLFYIKVVIFLW